MALKPRMFHRKTEGPDLKPYEKLVFLRTKTDYAKDDFVRSSWGQGPSKIKTRREIQLEIDAKAALAAPGHIICLVPPPGPCKALRALKGLIRPLRAL